MSPEEKAYYSAELHEAIWFQIGLYEENFLDLPDGFFTISFEYYNYNNLFALWPREQHYEIGIARNKLEQWEATWLPTKGEDVGTWIRFLIETPDDEIQEIINTYEIYKIMNLYKCLSGYCLNKFKQYLPRKGEVHVSV